MMMVRIRCQFVFIFLYAVLPRARGYFSLCLLHSSRSFCLRRFCSLGTEPHEKIIVLFRLFLVLLPPSGNSHQCSAAAILRGYSSKYTGEQGFSVKATGDFFALSCLTFCDCGVRIDWIVCIYSIILLTKCAVCRLERRLARLFRRGSFLYLESIFLSGATAVYGCEQATAADRQTAWTDPNLVIGAQQYATEPTTAERRLQLSTIGFSSLLYK